MVTIKNKNIEIETIEPNPKLDISLFKKRGNSKTFKGWIIVKMNEARKNENLEVAGLLQFIYKKYLEYEKINLKDLPEIEILGGWKGKGTIDINQTLFSEDISIKIPIKDKKTLEVKWSNKIIPKENVNRIICYIKKWKVGETHECYEFAEVIGENDWKEVWKKRTNVYFPLYYYPVKVLEAMGIVDYGGRGEITRIK